MRRAIAATATILLGSSLLVAEKKPYPLFGNGLDSLKALCVIKSTAQNGLKDNLRRFA